MRLIFTFKSRFQPCNCHISFTDNNDTEILKSYFFITYYKSSGNEEGGTLFFYFDCVLRCRLTLTIRRPRRKSDKRGEREEVQIIDAFS